MPHTRTAVEEIGPYIRFNNRLWVSSWGTLTPKEGSWSRVLLVNPKTGEPRKTEVEITWGKPGELRVYESHRKQPTYKYEDVGLYVVPVTDKDFTVMMRGQGEAKKLAAQVAATLKSEGYGAQEARGFAADVAEDVNFHSLARVLGGQSPDTSASYSSIASTLDYGIFEAAFFGLFLAMQFKDGATAKVIKEAVLAEENKFRRQEQAQKYHMRAASGGLRSSVLRIASELPKGDETRRRILQAVSGMGDALPLNVGDILVSSWGYDQTNIDYYEVVQATVKTVVIRRLEDKVVKRGQTDDWVMPIKGKFKGAPMRKKIKEWRGKPMVDISSYASAYFWDGLPKAQTNPMFGH